MVIFLLIDSAPLIVKSNTAKLAIEKFDNNQKQGKLANNSNK